MAYDTYATKDDVSSFTGKTVGELPANIDSLIRKASDLMTNSILIPIDLAAHGEALKNAACAQVEYWLELGDQDENTQKIKSYSAGSVSASYDDSPKNIICIRAKGYLNKLGLLYRGARTSIRLTESSDCI